MNSHSLWVNTIQRFLRVKPYEIRAVLWSFLYFFSLLCAYYIIRPMRDEMGVAGGVENLQWLFTGTFFVMLAAMPLFGWVTSRFSRKQFLPYVYYFFISNLLIFYFLFELDWSPVYIARAFFIWASVFNLFVVSVFWSFMTDLYTDTQAKRLFGFIAAGGTVGALTGPALTAVLAIPLGGMNLLLLSALFLGCAVLCIQRLIAWNQHSEDASQSSQKNLSVKSQPLGGSVIAGIQLVVKSPYLIGICFLMLLFTALATFLYFQQAQIIRDAFSDPNERTAVFAAIDFAVNALTILLQVFLTGRLISWIGLKWTLALVPVLLGVGFLVIGFSPILAVLVVVQVVRRAGNYAIMRPAREMLYVVLSREEKYKAKNFIDTVVYRGGDAVSSWIYTGLKSIGLSLGAIAWTAVPLAAIWAVVAYWLGKRQSELATHQETRT